MIDKKILRNILVELCREAVKETRVDVTSRVNQICRLFEPEYQESPRRPRIDLAIESPNEESEEMYEKGLWG